MWNKKRSGKGLATTRGHKAGINNVASLRSRQLDQLDLMAKELKNRAPLASYKRGYHLLCASCISQYRLTSDGNGPHLVESMCETCCENTKNGEYVNEECMLGDIGWLAQVNRAIYSV